MILFLGKIIGIMFGPAIIMTLIGFVIRKKYKKAAKILFILSVINVIVSFGLCAYAYELDFR